MSRLTRMQRLLVLVGALCATALVSTVIGFGAGLVELGLIFVLAAAALAWVMSRST